MSRADEKAMDAADEPATGPARVGGNGNGDPVAAQVQAQALEVVDDITRVDAQAWDQLLAACPRPTPFMRHGYLSALQRSGAAVADTGWQPLYLLARDPATQALTGACALYLKSHSYGEYVFDWAWADAWDKAGGQYYPKLLAAVPFTPVPGSRLLARDTNSRVALLQGMQTLAREQGWSSAHLLFMDEEDRAAAQAAGWLLRQGVQFHWSNRGVDQPPGQGQAQVQEQAADQPLLPYRDWADYLASLTRDKRKKLTQERGYVARAGVEFEVRRGVDISAQDWEHFYRCYTNTYREHHSTPYLSREFFALTQASDPGLWLMFIARRGGERVAASLLALDDSTRTAWGRYWGATEDIGHLHFAACYHEPLLWCVNQGWRRFEGGAQGEHKLARGLLPVATWSAHWLSDRGFSAAVARFLDRERQGMAGYMDELQAHSPFRR